MAHVAVIDLKYASGGARTLLDAVRSGLDMVPTFTHVAMNFFASFLGKATPVEIDFPKFHLGFAA